MASVGSGRKAQWSASLIAAMAMRISAMYRAPGDGLQIICQHLPTTHPPQSNDEAASASAREQVERFCLGTFDEHAELEHRIHSDNSVEWRQGECEMEAVQLKARMKSC